jgi:hypothetical protein
MQLVLLYESLLPCLAAAWLGLQPGSAETVVTDQELSVTNHQALTACMRIQDAVDHLWLTANVVVAMQLHYPRVAYNTRTKVQEDSHQHWSCTTSQVTDGATSEACKALIQQLLQRAAEQYMGLLEHGIHKGKARKASARSWHKRKDDGCAYVTCFVQLHTAHAAVRMYVATS